MKHLLVLVAFVFLAACSFDNGKFDPVEKKVSTKKEMSRGQKDLLTAARLGNVSLVEKAIAGLAVHEFSYSGFSETPMGLAVAADNLEVVKVLWAQSIDAFNLGSEQNNFERQVLRSRIQEQFRTLKHVKRAESIRVVLNKSAALLATEYAKKTQSVLELVAQSDFAAAQGLINRTGLSCQFVRNQIVQDLQADVIKDSAAVDKFLKQLSCAEEISSQDLQLLYEAELIRQFQRYFNAPALLAYLSNRPSLKSTLWNIDESGLWMSPALLMRISWSYENHWSRQDLLCPKLEVGALNCKEFADDDFNSSDYLIGKYGIKKTEFDLIYMKQGQVLGSYRRFKRQSRSNGRKADPVYRNASMYIHRIPYYGELGMPSRNEDGQVEYEEERLPWTVGIQQMLENHYFESDSFDDGQWEEIQEARRNSEEAERLRRQEEQGDQEEFVEESAEENAEHRNEQTPGDPDTIFGDLPGLDEPGDLPPPPPPLPGPTDLPEVE
ncbi:hypothetical protein AB1A81_05400 [Bdellovibrio bacteriovorus]|uniref:Uncharacterized protein n=1 Tax=Bdellovibrio bacteriovorus (strain ATCC 15356 / DSM 50701 / NCIMB 9529 / HD100) TaxID=264462 RepID=Q6MNQ9_BDEBA|nr:hypothetical protein [Bdellovibrio bacteriovorus]CAE79092.1 hypothetical protein predicted by Glimmer/Critica [Bdellovibrio bacteriovorus HD100]